MKIKDSTKFEEYDLRFLELLEEDSLYRKFLARKRKKLGLPKNGVKLTKKNLQYLKDEDFNTKLTKTARHLSLLYDLPVYWIDTLKLLILYNEPCPPDRDKYKPFAIKEEEDFLREVHIVVRESVSISQLKSLIDHHKNELSQTLKLLPETPKSKMNLKKIAQQKQVKKLKKLKGMSDYEVSEELGEKYKNLQDYSVVGIKRRRFEERIKKLAKREGFHKLKIKLLVGE